MKYWRKSPWRIIDNFIFIDKNSVPCLRTHFRTHLSPCSFFLFDSDMCEKWSLVCNRRQEFSLLILICTAFVNGSSCSTFPCNRESTIRQSNRIPAHLCMQSVALRPLSFMRRFLFIPLYFDAPSHCYIRATWTYFLVCYIRPGLVEIFHVAWVIALFISKSMQERTYCNMHGDCRWARMKYRWSKNENT